MQKKTDASKITAPNDLRERAAFGPICKNKRAGMRAVVAAPNGGKGADRSVVLIQAPDGSWFQTVKCWHGNHRERALALVAKYNVAPAKELTHACRMK